jgi:VWFA-related protein
MSLRRVAGLAALPAVLVGFPFHSQTASPQPQGATPTISVNAQLVNLPVVVRDQHGALVQNLTQADFALSVDGRPQAIRYFDRDNDLPLTLGLLIDTSGSVRSALDDERTASDAFLDEMMAAPANRAPDQAFLIQFAHEADLLQSLTASRPKLREALQQVGVEYANDQQDANQGNRNGDSGYGGYGHHHGMHGGGTALYDAVYLASNQLMQKQKGRKALVVLTDGEDRGSMETLTSSIAAAQRADTVVYAIYFKGEEHGYGGHGGGWGGGHGGQRGGEKPVDGKKVLEQMTGETGGRMFEVAGKETFAAIYTQIAEELRSQYRLGYTPDTAAAAEGYHRVALTLTKDKKLFVQTRDGYFASE